MEGRKEHSWVDSSKYFRRSSNPRAKIVSDLYENVTSSLISENCLSDALNSLEFSHEDGRNDNETRIVEKLKLHLIHQEKREEAKKFVELHQKLKGLNVLSNRASIMKLFYELFDKEATRALISQKGIRKPMVATAVVKNVNHMPLPATPIENGSGLNPNNNELMPSLGSERELYREVHRSQGRIPNFENYPGKDKMMQRLRQMANLRDDPSPDPSVAFLDKLNYRPNMKKSSSTDKEAINSTKHVNTPKPLKLALEDDTALQKDLIKDLIFVFQGIDGNLLRYTSRSTFEFIVKKNIHPALQSDALRLAELGYFYRKIKKYCESPIYGLMAQGLKHGLELELQEFYRLLAIVQSEIQPTVVDTPMTEQLSRSGEQMTMLKLTVWMFDCRPRLEVLASMIDSCEGKKGSELCSILYQYSLHGDPMIASVTKSLLSTVAKPLYLMLCQWILYGELEDPFEEFFIAADASCNKENLWHSKYDIRQNMLPNFIPLKTAEKILATGKNINFLKDICQIAKGYDGRQQIKTWLEESPVDCMFTEDNKVLNTAIEKAYKTTSEMVLNVLIHESKLIDHLKAIKSYLLLGQGDFIQHLLHLLQDELQKPANKLYTHNASAILESAVRATNAQFEDEEILSRLDTRILPSSDKDLGWDVFCLDYKSHGPIGTVLTDDIMIRYNQMFNALWRTKRVEMILATLWKDQVALFKCQKYIPELGPVLHRSQLLISEMIHFVHQTQYYIMFEATECAWDHLMEEVAKAVDLDEVIKAHNKFVGTITSRSLLSPEKRELLNQLRGIFNSVHELKTFLVDLDNRVEEELPNRKNLIPNSEETLLAQQQFFSSYIKQAKGKIETLYTTTQDLVRSFLLVLNRQTDLTLQYLSFRLDFNEYYQFKDSRLSEPLTYQHRRMSSMFDPMRMSLSASMISGNLPPSLSISETCFETD